MVATFPAIAPRMASRSFASTNHFTAISFYAFFGTECTPVLPLTCLLMTSASFE
jgi:hypothetical protein